MRRANGWASLWGITLLVASLGLALPCLSLAQTDPSAGEAGDDEEEEAAKYFAEGSKLYGEGKYPQAIEQLLKAYQIRPAPPILLNIARTYQKLDDKRNALKFYKEFLLKARMVDPNRPEVEKMVKELEQEVGGDTGAVTSSAGTDTPSARSSVEEPSLTPVDRKPQLIHTPVDSAKVGQAITLVAELPPDVDPSNATVVLYFRKSGEVQFRQLGMEAQGEAFVGQIPSRHVNSTSIQYYMEAIERKGDMMRVAGQSANKGNPHIIVIEGGVRRETRRTEGETGTTKPSDRSPYRLWVYVTAGLAVASLGTAAAMGALAKDRNDALESFVAEKSCPSGCTVPKFRFDEPVKTGGQSPEEWEKEGKAFNSAFIATLVIGSVAAAAAGTLLYFDLTYGKDSDEKKDEASRLRFTGSPFATTGGGGVVGRIDF